MIVKVDYDIYSEVYGLSPHIARTSWGDCRNWEEIEVTPEKLKELIDKCVPVSTIK